MGNHVGGEHLRAVDHAPEIDPQHLGPVRLRSEHRAAWLHAGVVHEHVHRAQARPHGLVQLAHARPIADISWHGEHVGRAAGCNGRDCVGRFVEPFVIAVRDADF